MPNIMFKVGNTDYSSNVVAEQYAVRSVPQYTAWTDANGKEHRSVYREQISGSFSMFFPTITDFNSFCAYLDTQVANDTSYPCQVWVNNKNASVSGDYFIDFDASRYADSKWADQVGKIKITIKER